MTRRMMMLAAVVLAVGAFGFGWAAAQTRTDGVRQLTAQDYFEIQMLYGRYTHAVDHGESDLEKDGMEYSGTYVPDGALITVGPGNPCPAPGGNWERGTREDIRGSISDVKKVADVCINKVVGTKNLAKVPVGFRSRQERHVQTNLLLTPTAEGANGTVYLNELNVLTHPPTWSSSGIFNDTLVKTPNGWRFKKRIITSDMLWTSLAK